MQCCGSVSGFHFDADQDPTCLVSLFLKRIQNPTLLLHGSRVSLTRLHSEPPRLHSEPPWLQNEPSQLFTLMRSGSGFCLCLLYSSGSGFWIWRGSDPQHWLFAQSALFPLDMETRFYLLITGISFKNLVSTFLRQRLKEKMMCFSFYKNAWFSVHTVNINV